MSYAVMGKVNVFSEETISFMAAFNIISMDKVNKQGCTDAVNSSIY